MQISFRAHYAVVHAHEMVIWVVDGISSHFHCNGYPDTGYSSPKSVASLLVPVRILFQGSSVQIKQAK